MLYPLPSGPIRLELSAVPIERTAFVLDGITCCGECKIENRPDADDLFGPGPFRGVKLCRDRWYFTYSNGDTIRIGNIRSGLARSADRVREVVWMESLQQGCELEFQMSN